MCNNCTGMSRKEFAAAVRLDPDHAEKVAESNYGDAITVEVNPLYAVIREDKTVLCVIGATIDGLKFFDSLEEYAL